MLTEVVLASNNVKKLAELQRVFAAADLDVQVRSLAEFPDHPDVAETATDFMGNALLKAKAAAEHCGIPAVADDSGLEVDLLNGMPGIFSARWAGRHGDDQGNLELLLAQLADVMHTHPQARFTCAIALVYPDGETSTWQASMEGSLIAEPRGENGFGYDPIFVPEGYDCTNAELSPGEKDAISHRGKALRMMMAELKGA